MGTKEVEAAAEAEPQREAILGASDKEQESRTKTERWFPSKLRTYGRVLGNCILHPKFWFETNFPWSLFLTNIFLGPDFLDMNPVGSDPNVHQGQYYYRIKIVISPKKERKKNRNKLVGCFFFKWIFEL